MATFLLKQNGNAEPFEAAADLAASGARAAGRPASLGESAHACASCGYQLDPVASAKIAGLRYVNDEAMPGLRRVGSPNRVRYVDASGRTIFRLCRAARIRALAIPPAWTDVWNCPSPLGHLQATGRDARGRKQYRYHPRWREVRDEVKYGRLIAFAEALPGIGRTNADLRKNGLPREKVPAAVALTNPTAHGGKASDAFHIVIPSMPGYGFSGKPTERRLGVRAQRIASTWTTLMRRLGYKKFVAQGGDWGSVVTEMIGVQAP